MDLTFIKQSGESNGDAGDQYIGSGGNDQKAPLLQVLPQQRHGVGRSGQAGDDDEPGILDQIAIEPLGPHVPHLDELFFLLAAAGDRCQEAAEPKGLAQT